MLARRAEEEGIAVIEDIAYRGSGVGHVNYDTIPSVNTLTQAGGIT